MPALLDNKFRSFQYIFYNVLIFFSLRKRVVFERNKKEKKIR